MTAPRTSADVLAGLGMTSNDVLTALGMDDPSRLAVGTPSQVNPTVLARAQAKLAAGQSLTREEAITVAHAKSADQFMSAVGKALQPFMALSDITKGLIGEAQGTPGSAVRGLKAGAGSFTYGAAEYLPGMTGARANGVSGAELLKGTKYENDPMAALAVELFADPSMLLFGAGVLTKGSATLGRISNLEKLAKTAEGKAFIQGALKAADSRGAQLLKLSDEVTGVPAAARAAAASPAGKAVKAGVAKLADTKLPNIPVVTAPIIREGGGTVGDAFFTPDMKTATYTPEQLARDEFRTDVRLAADDTARGITQATNADAKVLENLVKGLKPADAAEVNRLLGVFTTTTKPSVAAEALRKLNAIGTRLGRDLEAPFVAAVKATDRVSYQTLGTLLKAEGKPVVLDPVVTKAIQDAQSGADLVPLVGKYANEAGRPRPILLTQYTGRNAVDDAIAKAQLLPDSPARIDVTVPKLEATFTEEAAQVVPPPRPIEPVGVTPRGEIPANPASTAARIAETPVNVTPPFVEGAARQGVDTPVSPQEFLQDLFSTKLDAPPVAAASAAPTEGAQQATALIDTLRPFDNGTGIPENVAHVAYGNKGWASLGPQPDEVIDTLRQNLPPGTRVVTVPWGNKTQPVVINENLIRDRFQAMQADPDLARYTRPYQALSPEELMAEMFKSGKTDWEKWASDAVVGYTLGVSPKGVQNYLRGTNSAIASEGGKLWYEHPEFAGMDLQQPAPGYAFIDYADNPNLSAAADFQTQIARAQTPPVSGSKTLPAAAPVNTFTPPARTPQAVIEDLLDPAPPVRVDVEDVPVADPPAIPDVPAATSTPPAGPAAASPPAASATPPAASLTDAPAVTTKTPAQVLEDLLSPARPVDEITSPVPSQLWNPTPEGTAKGVALPTAAPETLVTRKVPTTYRTVDVDANALDWGSLPDDAARRAVLNSIDGAGNARFIPDATGATRLNRSDLTVPLDHPVISRYFPDEALMSAKRQGTTLGERTITRTERVPNWFNPREGTTVEFQRAAREQAMREAADEAFPNDLNGMLRDSEPFGTLDGWMVGDVFASDAKLALNPDRLPTRAALNDYAARVTALHGRPPTKGEVFRYRLQLARYRQAENFRTLDTAAAAKYVDDYARLHPEATLAEVGAALAREFNLGTPAAHALRRAMGQADSGLLRTMSKTERLEFMQRIKLKDGVRNGTPGGMLMQRLIRKPDEVSQEFLQAFPQEVNALKLIDEQVRTRTAAIVRSQVMREYHQHLRDGGMHVTAKEWQTLRRVPVNQLEPRLKALREQIAGSSDVGGVPAGWKIMDRSAGPFEKGDVIPWWSYFDLFGASNVEDAAVAASILRRHNPNGTYERLWRTQNALMLGTPSSVINDQVGQFMQMTLWGVTPDALLEGIVRRVTATPEQIAAMNKAGIQGTTLEASVLGDRQALQRLAQRLDGDTDQSRMGRVLDAVLRFRERGTGIDPTAMTGAAGIAADVAHLGSGYVFKARSRLADLQRESLYFHRIAVGDTPQQAAAYANQVLMDMRLVPAYARVVSKFWPFFNWIAMSAPRSVITVLRKPQVNAAYQRLGEATSERTDDEAARRTLLEGGWLNPKGGWWNLGVFAGRLPDSMINERNGTRLYVDPRNWDPTATIPQLLDWSGTKVGAVSLPWYATLWMSLQVGTDRFGGAVYAEVLDGQKGGFQEAYRIDPAGTLKIAARTIAQQFSPSYAPGSPRAKALVRSVLTTADLPDDGSRDITIAKSLAGTPQGRAWLLYMQQGNFAAIDQDLRGDRGSPYSTAPASLARSAVSFILPVRGINADQNEQGDAQQQLMIGQLNFSTWLSGERKRYAELGAGGASKARLRAEEDRITREADRRAAALDFKDRITR